jgi:hypothetical protein
MTEDRKPTARQVYEEAAKKYPGRFRIAPNTGTAIAIIGYPRPKKKDNSDEPAAE